MSQGHEYVLQVKGNQGQLRRAVAAGHAAGRAQVPVHTVQEQRRGQSTCWQTRYYAGPPPQLASPWPGLQGYVAVEKTVVRQGMRQQHTRFYITSLAKPELAELAAGIRGHWGIENGLHRARDVQFRQDTNGLRNPHVGVLIGLFNTLALNFLRHYVAPSLVQAQMKFAYNMPRFIAMFIT